MSNGEKKKWYNKKESNRFISKRNAKLAELGNSVGGPQIKMTTIKGLQGYGLFADKNYNKNEIITVYGGRLHYNMVQGDYVFRLCEKTPLYVDGEFDFHPTEKGRWLNHGSENGKDLFCGALDLSKPRANTEFYLSKKNDVPICYIKAIRNIFKGEEFFVDYGPLYW